MKKKRSVLMGIAVVMVLCMPTAAMAGEEMDFSAGSLIIPMDSTYQGGQDAVNDGGQLEAYGLVYYLLAHTDEEGENDITVYWVINDEKTSIGGIDLVIEDLTLEEDEAVVKVYDHAGGTSSIGTFRTGDGNQKISYLGGPFIIDGVDAEKAKTIIDQSGWAAVNIHEAQVPFAALVHRQMNGVPPKIALMNSEEDKTKGNAKILEAYLRLAGICPDAYELLTPNEIRDGKLHTGGYDFLWAPHWEGYNKTYGVDGNGNGILDVDEIVSQIATFLENGKGLLAECASIETFEHSPNGRFLTTKGIGHNGGTNDSNYVIYNDLTTANSQVGDFLYGPVGGHLHNWRPFVSGDPYTFAVPPDVTGGNSEYLDTVTRFTVDDTNNNDVVEDTDWDYYVGGYAFGDTRNGYVVYLGGHQYAKCDGLTDPSVHPLDFEFEKDIKNEQFTLMPKYHPGGSRKLTQRATPNAIQLEVDSTAGISAGDKLHITLKEAGTFHWTTVNQIIDGDTLTIVDKMPALAEIDDEVHVAVAFDKDHLNAKAGYPLEMDLTTAKVDKKKLTGVTFRNKGESSITVDSITLFWTGGDAGQKFKKITDTTNDVIYTMSAVSGQEVITGFTIESPFTGQSTCTNNGDCSWTNIAGVRYVLNTLFNIKFQIISREYVRASPIVRHPYLYQGSFEYPSYRGHFRCYDVTKSDEENVAQWDTAVGRIKEAKVYNHDTDARQVYTAGADGSKIAFDASQIEQLRGPLSITPENGVDQDEIDVITRVRGKEWDANQGAWVERVKKLGAIMHSAPVIVDSNSRTGDSRTEIAYVGDLYGMLHAIDIQDGEEKWAFIPRNLLGKLKNDRTDPNAVQNFAAVDGSPTAKDVYYDHDNDPETDKVWRTILVCPEGSGGNYIFALDVTDPDAWSVLWEVTDTESPGMGNAYRAAIGKVKLPVYDEEEFSNYEIKWMVFVATGYASMVDQHGGINVFAYDLSGQKQWKFSREYADAVNDIPGAVTLFDTDGDTFVDRVYVGDMNGRMWELNAVDGTNPNGENPLWNCGVGKPISASPAITRLHNGHVVVIFGTGGTDWASNEQAYAMYAVDATDGTLLWQLDLAVGEKVWSSATIAAGQVLFATAFGTMESANPRGDMGYTGKLRSVNLESGSESWSMDNIGKARGSLYVDRQHAYLSAIPNEIIQIGGEDFSSAGSANNVILRAWRQLH